MTLLEAERRREQSRQSKQQHTPFKRVIPFREWCALRGISVATGRRLAAAGKVRLTHLSERRIGVHEDDDAAYLAACRLEAE
jgi:hypothetical protein